MKPKGYFLAIWPRVGRYKEDWGAESEGLAEAAVNANVREYVPLLNRYLRGTRVSAGEKHFLRRRSTHSTVVSRSPVGHFRDNPL